MNSNCKGKVVCKKKQTAEPINQLRSVKTSLCVEANIWTHERGDNQRSVSFPVFFLIPQDESVSTATPSLLSHASMCLLLSVSVCLKFWSHLHSSPSVCLSFSLPPHTLCNTPSFFPVCLSLHLPACCSSSTSLSVPQDCCVYSFSLFVSFSSSGGWRRVSQSWLPQGCLGNNSCHFVVRQLTEKNEKRGQ